MILKYPRPERVTVAQGRMFGLMENRRFTAWIHGTFRDLSLTERNTLCSGVRRMILTGVTYYPYIFTLRGAVPPNEWFYYEDERDIMPPPKAFGGRHGAFDARFADTLGVMRLRELKGGGETRGGLAALASESGVSLSVLGNVLFYRNLPEGRSHTSFPSRNVIMQFRGRIVPEDWFLFPDEVSVTGRRGQ